MELLQEFFVTALLAVFFSFLIAKLVSKAMGGGDSQVSKTLNVDQEIVIDSNDGLQYRERLQVDKFKSEKRVEFVAEGAQLVDRFFEGPFEIEEVEKSVNRDDVIGAEFCELPPKSIQDASKEDKESLEEISGNNRTEFQLKRGSALRFADDSKSAIEEPQEVIDEKKRGFDDNLIVENMKTGTEFSVQKDVIEEPEEIKAVESEAKEKSDEKKIEIESDDDDWEGIERSELENIFAKVAKLVESGDKDEDLTRAGSDVQMELYGLHKVAMEGPCREQAPISLKVAARAKCDGGHWLPCARNAWQKLGNMSPEVAMERYIALVSDKVPGWMEDKSTGDGKPGPTKAANIGVVASDISSSHDPDFTGERSIAELMPSTENNDLTEGPILESRVKE